MTLLLSSRSSGLAVFCLSISLLIGCSGGATSNGSVVTGTVTYNGTVVPRAEVTVYSKANPTNLPLTINTRDDGGFESKDLAPGEYEVTVVTKVFTMGGSGGAATPGGKSDPRMVGKGGPAAGGMSKEAQAKAAEMGKEKATAPSAGVTLPAKYSKKETSKLTLNVVAGKNPPVTLDLVD